jgi:prepilin-type N-terminal cleavage/methylation domain-containing protein
MKNTRGFTLVEILITMCILGIIASFMAPTFTSSIQRAHATTCVLYRQNIQTAADIYIKTHNLMPGDPLPTIAQLENENLLAGEERCPSGGIYVWSNPTYQGPSVPFLVSCSIHFMTVEEQGKYRKGLD